MDCLCGNDATEKVGIKIEQDARAAERIEALQLQQCLAEAEDVDEQHCYNDTRKG